MPTLQVSEIGTTKSGRAKIRCGKDVYYCGNGVPTPPVGSTILADTSDGSFDGEGGKRISMWYLNKWQFADGAQQPIHAQPGLTQAAPAATPAPQSSQAGLPMEPGDVLRFISNVVGQAISAKTISDPEDVWGWANTALNVARALRDGTKLEGKPKPPPAGQVSERYPMNDKLESFTDDSKIPF